MLLDLPRPVIIAHRGASARAPENTMAAFELAARDGAAVIELDAQLTADDRVVVFHDKTLARSTGASGRVQESTLEQLRELDAGSAFSKSFMGQKIPSLEEVFGGFASKLCFNVHIKGSGRKQHRLIEGICALVRRHRLESRVLFSSFWPPDLRQAAQWLPQVPRALLAAPGWRGAWARSFAFSFGEYAALHPHRSDVTAQEVQRVHKLARRVHAWTVNDREEIAQLAAWGVDGILTDDPRLAGEALGSRT